MAGDVLHHNPLAAMGGRTARTDTVADGQALDRGVVLRRQPGRYAVDEKLAGGVHQQDGADHVGPLHLDAADDEGENLPQVAARGHELEDAVADFEDGLLPGVEFFLQAQAHGSMVEGIHELGHFLGRGGDLQAGAAVLLESRGKCRRALDVAHRMPQQDQEQQGAADDGEQRGDEGVAPDMGAHRIVFGQGQFRLHPADDAVVAHRVPGDDAAGADADTVLRTPRGRLLSCVGRRQGGARPVAAYRPDHPAVGRRQDQGQDGIAMGRLQEAAGDAVVIPGPDAGHAAIRQGRGKGDGVPLQGRLGELPLLMGDVETEEPHAGCNGDGPQKDQANVETAGEIGHRQVLRYISLGELVIVSPYGWQGYAAAISPAAGQSVCPGPAAGRGSKLTVAVCRRMSFVPAPAS